MALDKNIGFRKAYQITGEPGYAGDTAKTEIDPGKGGSHRDNNWKISAGQAKLRNAGKIGPNENVTEYTK